VEDPPADPLDDLVVEPEDRGHRAGVAARGLSHRQPALTHERDRLLDLERPRSGECGELADGVADDEVRLDPSSADPGKHGETGRHESGLLHLRLYELLLGRAEAEP